MWCKHGYKMPTPPPTPMPPPAPTPAPAPAPSPKCPSGYPVLCWQGDCCCAAASECTGDCDGSCQRNVWAWAY
jgi:hypothetical protein